MVINRNTLGKLEEPQLILVKASGERVGVLGCTSKTWEHTYNDLDTLSFEIAMYTDNIKTAFYDDIDVMKYIEIPTIGRFSIKDIEISSEGQRIEYKKVTCQSYEVLLSTRYLEEFSINTGVTGAIDGVSFYSPGDQTKSLMHLVLELFPEWSIGHVDAALWTMKRSFEVTRQDVYSFIMKDMAEAFSCVFTFDTLNKTINAYQDTNYGIDTNVHISYNTLLENSEMSYSTDEIKTALKLEGEDGLSVREVCMGYDTIYNVDYYADTQYMSVSLLNAYTNWKNLVNTTVDLNLFTYKTGVITRAELSGKSYKDAYTLLLAKYQNYYTDISKWTSTLLPYLVNSRRNPGYGTVSYTEDGSDAVTFARQTSTQLVTSLPSSGDENVLYLIKDTNNMYRWNGSWVDVNKWYNCCLAELKTLQASAENLQAVAMKAGYGDAESTDTTIQARYVDTYLPSLYMYNALTKQIAAVNATLAELNTNQGIIQTDKSVITNKTAMQNNFTDAQLKELSTFIREDELTSDNYVVTDVMTESERFDMLYAMLEYGQKELAKVAQPQIQFSIGMINLFALKEFDDYSGDFDLGNYVWVTIRDDYSIKAKILGISLDFLDQSKITVTFGNVMRTARTIFTDVTEALNAATSAATSVSFGASHWSASAEQTDSIGKALADGLLSQSYYLANAEDNETLIDENGIWITTTTGQHGRETTDNFDSIYLGGGRILFTDDGWRSVSMSVGRADVDMPSINSSGELIFTKESLFGTFADFLIAGYVGGSIIVGGDIYSANYKTSSSKNTGNAGTHINLTDGTFEFNDKTAGRKRLVLKDNTLEVNGIIHAREGNIGSDDNGDGGFIIKNKKLYSGKTSYNDTNRGIYLGSDEGIALGVYNSSTQRNPFSVDMNGYLTANSGKIANFNLNNTSLYTTKSGMSDNHNGIYIGDDGIALGLNNKFYVNNEGYLYSTSGQIGGFTITNSSLYKDKSSFYEATNGLYIGTDGIAFGDDNRFYVHVNGSSSEARIGNFTVKTNQLYNGKETLDANADGVYLGINGISLGSLQEDGSPKFKVTNQGALTATSGNIGGWSINRYGLSSNNINISSSGSVYHSANGESNWGINSDGYAYFKDVFITGVNSGSSFGSIGYDGSTTWGSFSGASYFGCDEDIEPFSGGAVAHIQSLAVGQITADNIDAAHASLESLHFQGQEVTWSSITYVTSVSLSSEDSNTAYVSTSPGGTAYIKDTSGTTQSVPTDVGTTSISYHKKIKLSYSTAKSTVLGASEPSSHSSSADIISIT